MTEQLHNEYKQEAKTTLERAQDSLLRNDAHELRTNTLTMLEQYEQETKKTLEKIPRSAFTESFDGKVRIQQQYNEFEILANTLQKEMGAVTYLDRLRDRATLINDLSGRIAKTRVETEEKVKALQKEYGTYTRPTEYRPQKSPEMWGHHPLLPQGTLDCSLFGLGPDEMLSYDQKVEISKALFTVFERLQAQGKGGKKPFKPIQKWGEIVHFDNEWTSFDTTITLKELGIHIPQAECAVIEKAIFHNKELIASYFNQLREAYTQGSIDGFTKPLKSSELVHSGFLHHDGTCDGNVAGKSIKEILKPGAPDVLILTTTNQVPNIIIYTHNKRVFKEFPDIPVNIQPGDKISGYETRV